MKLDSCYRTTITRQVIRTRIPSLFFTHRQIRSWELPEDLQCVLNRPVQLCPLRKRNNPHLDLLPRDLCRVQHRPN